ncbi:hypothetical protein GCM10023091_28500 [Ravibacter arvi]|uniref:Uncharacterized protein n=1 Tax=Ravibacter arvi TaxID=2051041 RepID=A0ABP8M0T5_9BACT
MKTFRILLAALAVATAFGLNASAFKSNGVVTASSVEPMYLITDDQNDFYGTTANKTDTETRCPGSDRECALEQNAQGAPEVIKWDGPQIKF